MLYSFDQFIKESHSSNTPPNYRKAEGNKTCENCGAFDSRVKNGSQNGYCEMFEVQVKKDYTCDDWVNEQQWQQHVNENEEQERWDNHKLEQILPYIKDKAIFHGSSQKINEFDPDKIKGGARSVHGWGIYFANSPYKALENGKILTFLDIRDMNILDIRNKVDDQFIDNFIYAAKQHGKETSNSIREAIASVMADKINKNRQWFIDNKDIDNFRKDLQDLVQNPSVDQIFSQILQQNMGYDIMRHNVEFILINIEKGNQNIIEDIYQFIEQNK